MATGPGVYFILAVLPLVLLLVESCDRKLLDMVKVCHQEMSGMPRLHTGPLLIVDDMAMMEAHCRQNVSANAVRSCMSKLYNCKEHAQMKRHCDLASLEPERLVQRIQLTCAVVQSIKSEIGCVNNQTCNMKPCLSSIARQPHHRTFAILSPPIHQADSVCSWLDRVKSCYDKHVRPVCSDVITNYLTAMLDTYKPPSCSTTPS